MMLRLRQTRPLCKSCRNDLLRLFEDGFSHRTANNSRYASRAFPYRQSLRQFSYQRTRFESKVYNQNEVADHLPSDEQTVEHAQSVANGEVIDLLEKELGMSLQEAIKQDRAAVEALVQKLSLGDDSEISLEAAQDPLQEMRDDGASQAEVVREARNIFGDSLPEGVLRDEEFVLYRRLYGEPSPDVEEGLQDHEDDVDIDLETAPQNALYSADGQEIEYSVKKQESHSHPSAGMQGSVPSSDELTAYGKVSGRSIDRTHSVVQDLAEVLGGRLVETERNEFDEDLEDDQEDSIAREHPLTTLGKFATSPRTIFLPSYDFVRPIEKLMGGYSNKHLKEMCERTFGGPGLPDSPLTPRSGRFKQQVPIPLEAGQSTMGEMEANAFVTSVMPPTYASILSVLVETRKRLGTSWLTRLLAREGGPRVLDASAGGVGIIAWREMVKAQWDAMHSSDQRPPPVPATKSVVLTGSNALRHRAADMLENTTFVPRLPDYVHTRDAPTLEDDRPAQQRKKFDVIIAPHSLFSLKEEWMRKQHVQNLWSLLDPEGGVLILIEKGIPRGFEAIAGAREMLLERYIASPPGHEMSYSKIADDSIHKKETAMIVAPCTNHEKCPMYTVPGLSRGRRDICSFQQRYIRPPFLQRILGAGDRNHDDVDYSYLSIMKGDDLRTRRLVDWSHVKDPSSAPARTAQPDSYSAWLDKVQAGFEDVTPDHSTRTSLPGAHQLPRAILPPIKRKGHVSLDVCTPAGKIERWTVPRSFSKQAYRDARKSRWGDLWALGAKTRTPRNLSLGVSAKDLGSEKKMSEGKGRGRKERLKIKAQKILETREQDRLNEIEEQEELMKDLDAEFGDEQPVFKPVSKPVAVKTNTHRQDPSDMSEDDVNQVLSDWQSGYDMLEAGSKKQARRLNKLDKKKLKKEGRTQYRGEALNRARR